MQSSSEQPLVGSDALRDYSGSGCKGDYTITIMIVIIIIITFIIIILINIIIIIVITIIITITVMVVIIIIITYIIIMMINFIIYIVITIIIIIIVTTITLSLLAISTSRLSSLQLQSSPYKRTPSLTTFLFSGFYHLFALGIPYMGL